MKYKMFNHKLLLLPIVTSACLFLFFAGCESSQKKEQVRLEDLRSVIVTNTENEDIRLSFTAIVSGAERKINEGNNPQAAKILNGLADIAYATKENYFTNESVVEIIRSINNSFQNYELGMAASKIFVDKSCSGDGTGCSIDSPGTICVEAIRGRLN